MLNVLNIYTKGHDSKYNRHPPPPENNNKILMVIFDWQANCLYQINDHRN